MIRGEAESYGSRRVLDESTDSKSLRGRRSVWVEGSVPWWAVMKVVSKWEGHCSNAQWIDWERRTEKQDLLF